MPAGRSGGAARRRRVRRHAPRRRCGRSVGGDRQAPSRARRGPRRGRLPAAAERRESRPTRTTAPPRRSSFEPPTRRSTTPRRAARTRSSDSGRSCEARSPTDLPAARSDRSRSGSSTDGSALVGAMDAAVAIWAEESLGEVLERLGKAIAFVVGATATNISKVEGPSPCRHDQACLAGRRSG